MKILYSLIAIPVLLICLAPSHILSAQNSFLSVSTTSVASSKIDKDNNTTEIEQTITTVKGTLPIPFGETNTLMLSPTWQQHRLKWKKFQSENSLLKSDMPDDLQTAELAVGILHRLGDGWSVMGRISGGIKSDFENIDSDDAVYGGLISARRNFTGNNHLGLGVTYTDSFGSPQVVPLLMFGWTASEHFFCRGTLPVNLKAGYIHSKRLSTGLAIDVTGNHYRLSEIGSWKKGVLNFTEVLAGPYIDLGVTARVHLILKGGVVTGQKLEFKDRYDTDKILSEEDLEDSTFISVSLYAPF